MNLKAAAMRKLAKMKKKHEEMELDGDEAPPPMPPPHARPSITIAIEHAPPHAGHPFGARGNAKG